MNELQINKLKEQGYRISSDVIDIDYKYIHEQLSTTYWAKSRSFEQTKRAFENSLVMVIVKDNRVIGFARLITDYAIFAYLADVFIDPNHRGQGLSKWLVDELINNPQTKIIKKIMLRTADAQKLYQQFGFQESPNPDRNMELIRS